MSESSGGLNVRALVNASALVFAASLALNAGGFLFHAIASRKLGVDAYGNFYALLSLYSLAGLPFAIFTPVVTKYSAEFGALHDDAHMRGLIDLFAKIFVAVGLGYIVAGVVFSLPLGSFLHVPSWEIPVVGVMCAAGVLSATMRAIGQGVHAYTAYAVSNAGEGFGKIVALAVVALAGVSMFGTIAAFLFGIIAGAVLMAVPLVLRYRSVAPAAVVLDWRRIAATTGGAAVMTLMLTCMGFADVLLVKHFFPAEQAGLYAAVALCARILFYFVGFIPAILIPQATHRHARGERTRRVLMLALAFIGIVSIAGLFVYRYLGALLLHALVGHAFDAGLPLLPTYGAAMASLAIANSLGAYGIATHRLGFSVPMLLAMLGTLGWIAMVHPTLQTVVNELLIGCVAIVLAVVVPLAVQGARSVRA